MKFEETKYKDQLKYSKLNFSFGVVYLFDEFLISEINAEVHLDKQKVTEMMEAVIEFYGTNAKISYISNRIHPYSSNPQLWVEAIKTHDIIDAGAIVYYTLSSLMNFEIESYMCPKPIESFNNLEKAIEWIKSSKSSFNQS